MNEPKLRSKRWDLSKESEIWELWQKEEIYKFNMNSGKPIFIIDNPPPYVSGRWHVGGAIHYAAIDYIARFIRMKGYEVHYKFGLDRNGLPVEVSVEKEFGIKMRETPREEFIAKCRQYLDTVGDSILNICKKLGFSNNSWKWEEIYKTDHETYRALTQETFIQLWNEGLIYEDDRPNSWCTDCQTVIADAEVERREQVTTLVTINFKVKESGENLPIATTRPELICACDAVLVNPEDERYKQLHGKTAITPLYNKEVRIIPHPSAKPEFGTGALMVCSYGDITDLRHFRELNLKPTFSIDKDGYMTEAAGKYRGMKVEEARKAIINDLKRQGLLVKEEKITQSQPICWRSKTPIEFVGMKEYYLKQVDFVEPLKEITEDIIWHPPTAKKLWLDWLNSITMDWPISRRRYYGTEIPVWYCKSCGEPHLPKPGKYYQPWREKAPFDKCKKCGSTEGFIGDERTLDTWMDSSISPLYILKYPHASNDTEFFEREIKRDYVSDLRPQGRDIIGTWLSYSLLRIYQLYKKPAFKHVWISGHVVDAEGRKLSKSLGNVIYPEPLIEKYGADAVRLYGAMASTLGSDIRFDEKRLGGISRFINKLYNIARFISTFPEPKEDEIKLSATDKWIISELNKLIRRVNESYETFDFHIGAEEIYNYVWNIFASHIVEMVKTRAYNRNHDFTEVEQKNAEWTLHQCLKTILKLLAPITPFVTDYIWRSIYSKESIHIQKFPEADPRLILTEDPTPIIVKTNSAIWKAKKDANISLKQPIEYANLPKELEPFAQDLKQMHNIKQVTFTDQPKLKNVRTYQVEGKEIQLKI
ncbi:MAG: valine--tRNA ligase [Candidatus Freyarchaeota archaeon]|nr:valine--tRNA ligase [Candidatus Jordarchaeia archaeon]MBS7269821.1 valine--tRNA ligase [Candidatus Jordarchaeia archaeon]MBS7280553.1 valine--tRNA ligase [Candidatus Jordarchaeia archaeon]